MNALPRTQHLQVVTPVQTDAPLIVFDQVALDLRMEVGQLTETVTVAAAAPMLKSETSEVSIEVNPKSYNDLPVTSSGGRSVLRERACMLARDAIARSVINDSVPPAIAMSASPRLMK